jgi:hypothetical protein
VSEEGNEGEGSLRRYGSNTIIDNFVVWGELKRGNMKLHSVVNK